jgi:hypothetical protein
VILVAYLMLVRSMDEWLVLLPDRMPAYISVEQYEGNQTRLATTWLTPGCSYTAGGKPGATSPRLTNSNSSSEVRLVQTNVKKVLAEFGDDTTRYADAKARKNYAGTSPITRQSGKKKTVLARYVHNDRLLDALNRQAFAALPASPGARAYYDRLRARCVGHHAGLRRLGNRLVGIPHGCLKTHSTYDETTAWAHRQQDLQTAASQQTHGISSPSGRRAD